MPYDENDIEDFEEFVGYYRLDDEDTEFDNTEFDIEDTDNEIHELYF